MNGHVKQRAQASIEDMNNIIGSIREPLVMIDSELKVVKANNPFYKTFKLNPETTEGVVLFELDNRQWDIPELRPLLEKILPEKTLLTEFEIEHDFGSMGRKILHINARQIFRMSNQTWLILLAIKDVTDRELYKRNLEDIVKKSTDELVVAKDETEKGKHFTETTLFEIKRLKDQIEVERTYPQEAIKLEFNHEDIIGQSDSLKYVLFKIEQIASSDTIVLLLGETGTGKELVARAIHNLSSRKNKLLVKVNCATLSASLIESELFGHDKGAFTDAHTRQLGRFEVADGTTLFLDEIGELPLELQPKLLRVIQEGEFERLGSSRTIKVDTRIITATNRNLEAEVQKGCFREDLWYRLNVFPITVPPLRDRLDDLPLLTEYFVERICMRMGKSIKIIPEMVMNALQNYHWPGNIRELENVLERAVINSSGPKLRLVDKLNKPFTDSTLKPKTLKAVERDYILQILEQTRWKVSGKNSASEILGLDRSTLRTRMRKLNIVKP